MNDQETNAQHPRNEFYPTRMDSVYTQGVESGRLTYQRRTPKLVRWFKTITKPSKIYGTIKRFIEKWKRPPPK